MNGPFLQQGLHFGLNTVRCFKSSMDFPIHVQKAADSTPWLEIDSARLRIFIWKSAESVGAGRNMTIF
jgi:hypothetical protein